MLEMFTIPLLLLCLSITSSSHPLQPRQSVVPPPECDVIPTWEVTNFVWFNSTHNLDCVTEIDVPNVCFNSTSTGLVGCDGNLGPCDECGVYGCDTGLPYQPAGYGPPDDIKISTNVVGYTNCEESNPQSIRRYEVGQGIVLCGGPAYRINFYGDSNSSPTTGHIDFAPINRWACTNGSTIQGSGSVDFELDCTYDSGNNATCLIPDGESVTIPLLSYQIT